MHEHDSTSVFFVTAPDGVESVEVDTAIRSTSRSQLFALWFRLGCTESESIAGRPIANGLDVIKLNYGYFSR